MKSALVLLICVAAFAYSNPAAKSKTWRWKPLTPMFKPMHKAKSPQPDKIDSRPIPKTQGTWKPEVCGQRPEMPPGIVNGIEALPHSYPWQVALFMDDMFYCGGSLISNEYVITAGHCVSGFSKIEVVLGAHDITEDELSQLSHVVTGTGIIPHEEYDGLTLNNDLGLLRLPEPVTFTDEIQPICLPSYSDKDVSPGSMLTATGWGNTVDSSMESPTSDVLLQVTNPSIDNVVCEAYYGRFLISQNNICTTTRGPEMKGLCSGDSGGPLQMDINGKIILSGVTSFVSYEGCALGYPDAFSRVTKFLDWIEENSNLEIAL